MFNLILGPMFSGKTSALISRYNRYTIGGKRAIMIKYKNDTRYDSQQIVTHDNIRVNAVVCENLYQVDQKIKDCDVICIDEVQFYRDAHIFCDKWVNQGKIVEACGLNGTFNRKPFDMISKLIPLVENITYLTAVCRATGNDAHYSKRLIQDDSVEVIGGEDIYTAVDRKTFFENDYVNDTCDKLDELIDIYAKVNNKKVDRNNKAGLIYQYRKKYNSSPSYNTLLKKL